MVLNVVPLIGGLYVWWQWRQGRVTMRSMSEESQSTLVVVVVSGLAFAVITWFIMPVARWLRDYPTWHLRQGPAWAWVIPAGGGWAAWIVLSLAGMLAAAAALLLAGIGIWNLLRDGPVSPPAKHPAENGPVPPMAEHPAARGRPAQRGGPEFAVRGSATPRQRASGAAPLVLERPGSAVGGTPRDAGLPS